jgi:hypothetical protein
MPRDLGAPTRQGLHGFHRILGFGVNGVERADRARGCKRFLRNFDGDHLAAYSRCDLDCG